MLCLLSLGSLRAAEPTADELVDQLSSRNLSVIQGFSENFDYTRPPGIQTALLAEDVEWLNTEISKVQTAVVVYLALYLTKTHARAELERKDVELKYLAQVHSFLQKLDSTMKKWKAKCKGIKPSQISGLYLKS